MDSKLITMLIHNRFVHFLKLGEAKSAELREMVPLMQGMCERASQNRVIQGGDVLKDTIEHIAAVATHFSCILEPTRHAEITSTLSESRDGILQLVRITLKHAPYWQKLEMEAKAVAIAERTLGVELTALTTELQNGVLGADGKFVARLPVFLDTLPESSSKRLLQQLHDYQHKRLGALRLSVHEESNEATLQELNTLAENSGKALNIVRQELWQ
eukprot:6490548-Amphidinium_carterae.1